MSQILHEYGKKFSQVREQYSDGNNGRCAIGVLMSYFGWDGKHLFDTTNTLQFALYALKRLGSTLIQ
jgi:hypothetical protein